MNQNGYGFKSSSSIISRTLRNIIIINNLLKFVKSTILFESEHFGTKQLVYLLPTPLNLFGTQNQSIKRQARREAEGFSKTTTTKSSRAFLYPSSVRRTHSSSAKTSKIAHIETFQTSDFRAFVSHLLYYILKILAARGVRWDVT